MLLAIPSYGFADNSLHELGTWKDLLLSNCKPMYKLDLLQELSHSSRGQSHLWPSLASPHSPFSELQYNISNQHHNIEGRKHKKRLEERTSNQFKLYYCSSFIESPARSCNLFTSPTAVDNFGWRTSCNLNAKRAKWGGQNTNMCKVQHNFLEQKVRDKYLSTYYQDGRSKWWGILHGELQPQ